MTLFIETAKEQDIYDRVTPLIETFREREKTRGSFGSFPADNIADLITCGYTTLPAQEGGLSTKELVLAQSLIGSGDGSTALAIGWRVSTVMDLMHDEEWESEAKQFLLNEVRNGALVNYLLSERGQGSPARGGRIGTVATPTEEGYKLSGQKSFATLSPALDYFIVSARVAGVEGKEALFIVPKEARGVSVGDGWDSVALRGTASHDVTFEDVELPKRAFASWKKIGEKENVTGGFLHIPACYFGIARAARDEAVQFANDYVPNSFGRPIIEASHVAEKIGRIEWLLARSKHSLFYVAELYDRLAGDERLNEELGSVKLTVVNDAIEITDLAMRVLGSHSLSERGLSYKYYLNVRAGLHNPPADDELIQQLTNRVKATKEPVLS